MKVSEFHSWGCLVAIATTDAAIDASVMDLMSTLEMKLRSCQLSAHLAIHLFLLLNPLLYHQRNNHPFFLKLRTLSSVAYSTSSKQQQTISQPS